MKLISKDIDELLFAQYEKGSDLNSQMVVAKIYNPNGLGEWYLLNSDPNDPDYLWAIVDMFELEIGSVSRRELEDNSMQRDYSWNPINAKVLYQKLRQIDRYKEGGVVGKGASFLHLYKLTDKNGLYHVESYDGEAMSPKEAMQKMGISMYGLKSTKYKGLSSSTDNYKKWYHKKDIGYSDTEAWEELFENEEKFEDGGAVKSKVSNLLNKLEGALSKKDSEMFNDISNEIHEISDGVGLTEFEYTKWDDLRSKMNDYEISNYSRNFADGGSVENSSQQLNASLKIQPDFPYKNTANRWLSDHLKHSLKYKLALLLLRGVKDPDDVLNITDTLQYARLLRSLEKAKGESKHEMTFRTDNYTIAEAEEWARESLETMFYVEVDTTKFADGGAVKRVKMIKESDITEGAKFKLNNGEEIVILNLFTESFGNKWAKYTRNGVEYENTVNQLKNFINNWRAEIK